MPRFQEPPQDQIVPEEAFTDHGGCFFLGAAGVRFWTVPSNTRSRRKATMSSRRWLPSPSAQGRAARGVPQPAPESRAAQVKQPTGFFGVKLSQTWKLKPSRSLPEACPALRGGGGVQERLAEGPQLRYVPQPFLP